MSREEEILNELDEIKEEEHWINLSTDFLSKDDHARLRDLDNKRYFLREELKKIRSAV